MWKKRVLKVNTGKNKVVLMKMELSVLLLLSGELVWNKWTGLNMLVVWRMEDTIDADIDSKVKQGGEVAGAIITIDA